MTRPELNNMEDVANYIHALESKNEQLEAENKSLNEENAKLVEEKFGIYARLLNENAELKQTYAEMKQVYDQLEKRIDVAEANNKSIIQIGADRIKAAEAEYNTIHYYDLKKIFAEMDDQLLIDNLRDIHTAWYHARSIGLIADEFERRLNLKES